MKLTRDICRLLGLGGDGPGEEEMEVQDGAEQTDRRKDQSSSQLKPMLNCLDAVSLMAARCWASWDSIQKAMLNSEEGLEDEERTRRRAERRRAKRKRQKERKKLEREERMEDASEQEEEVAGAVSDSDSEEELKEEEEEKEEKEEWTPVRPRNKFNPESVPALVTTENKSNRQLPHRTSEENMNEAEAHHTFLGPRKEDQDLYFKEPEWDVSSAFVAKAASHIKLKAPKNRATQISRENKENETRSSQVENKMKRRGESLTVQGIQMFEQGQYSQAVDMFTKAIDCDPEDHRFYGNRSYCYWCLEQYGPALTDAQRSIQLAPDWPKGYFRKGCALMGLKRYSEAEKAIEQVLKLDPHCKEACSKLNTCRVLQLMVLGFEEEQSKLLLEKFTTVQAVLTSPEAKTLKHTSELDRSGSCRSLWVGNITLEVTEKDLWDLFKMFGEIESIRVLHERFCAFVNFKNANMAATALENLQGVELGSSKLVMRYPDRWVQRTLPTIQRTNTSLSSTAAGTQQSSAAGPRRCVPIDGDKCFYWRTTGCFYGDKCRFKHIPDQQGRDKKL
ncbi:stress-induced-phosphoprotein 1 isoform X2 [Dicentrarchus labrax]|uniref:stress-induced-phosphoprotein 1 isoform X2 n=1 Tax=Dicentrarchus labrax TaxID=13489 RepID=UPI0016333AD6|nr:stress-induced-phosphoprotein 1 isoform X2 [Dicentrarchus labrax]